MKAPTLAALAAACLLSACGFVPPEPPKPTDGPRLRINHAPPFATPVQEAAATPAAPQALADAQKPADTAALEALHLQAIQELTNQIRSLKEEVAAKQLGSPAPGQPIAAAQQLPPSGPAVAIAPNPAPAAPGGSIRMTELPPAGGDSSIPAPIDSIPVPSAPQANSPMLTQTRLIPREPDPAPPAVTAAPGPGAVDIAAPTLPQASPAPEDVPPPASPAESEPPETAQAPAPRIWRIEPADHTVRQALARWAADEGWTFGPDQWLVPWDLPIEARATFSATSFREAVQALSEAVALSESPIRPCLYANQVLRVIPYNQSCDRTTSRMVRR